MRRIAIDTHVVDFLLARTDLRVALTEHGARGALTIIANHVVEDQLAATPDADKRAALLALYGALPQERYDTAGFIMDISRLDRAALEDEGAVPLDALSTRQRGRWHDALIGATAAAHADVLVTDDQDLAAKMRRSGVTCTVWSIEEFARFLRADVP